MSLVLIHGIGNAESSAVRIQKEWVDALVRGGANRIRIEAAAPVAGFYGDILSAGKGGIGFQALPKFDPAKAEFLAEAAKEVEAAYRESLLKLAKGQAKSAMGGAKFGFTKLVKGVKLSDLTVVLELLDEVYDYLTKDELREAIDERVSEVFTAKAPTILAHSLGSVVAYRLLKARAAAGRPASKRLITFGSPLSIPAVRRLLDGPFDYPTALGDWRNCYDLFDPVPLGRPFPRPRGGDGKIRHVRVDNETTLNHMADGYLDKVPVAKWVTEIVGS